MFTRGELLVATFLACSVGAASAAVAGERPFKGRGSGVQSSVCNANLCTNHEEGTYVGAHVGRSTYVSDWTSEFDTPSCGTAAGHTALTAANGDQIFSDFEDDFCFDANNVAAYSGTYTVTGGTGRFSDVTGNGTISGTDDCSSLPCRDTTFTQGRGNY